MRNKSGQDLSKLLFHFNFIPLSYHNGLFDSQRYVDDVQRVQRTSGTVQETRIDAIREAVQYSQRQVD